MSIRVGLIGAGYWGRNIARASIDSKILHLDRVYDIDYGRALELARMYGVKAYRDLERFIEEGDLDAILIAVPADQLYPVALKVIERKKNLFIEKPVGVNLREVRDLRIKCENHGLVAVPGFISRFDPVVRYFRELIKERGSPTYISIQRSGRRAERYIRTHILLDLGVHDIDILFFLLEKDIDVINAEITKINNDLAYTAYMKYEGGFAVLHSDPLPLMKIRKLIINFDDRSFYEGDLVTSEVREVFREGISKYNKIIAEEEPLIAELKAFAERVLGRDSEAPTLRDAERVHEIVERILRIGGK